MTIFSDDIAINNSSSNANPLVSLHYQGVFICFKITLLIFLALNVSTANAICPNGKHIQTVNYRTFQTYEDALLLCVNLPYRSRSGGIGGNSSGRYVWQIKQETNSECAWINQCYFYENNECPTGQVPDPTQSNLCITPEIIPVENKKDLGKICGSDSDKPDISNTCVRSTSNKYQQKVDYTGVNASLSAIRHYNSGLGTIERGLCFGWPHQLTPSLEVSTTFIMVDQTDDRAEPSH